MNVIEQLLEERSTRLQSEKEKKNQEIKQEAEKLLANLKEHIGPTLLEIFNPVLHGTMRTGNGGRLEAIEFEIPALHEYKLAPIEIDWRASSYYNGYPFTVMGNNYQTMESAIAAAREKYPDYVKRAREAELKPLKADLSYHYGTKDEAKAREIHARLLEIDPDQKADWDELLAKWYSNRDYDVKQTEEHRVYEAVKQAKQAAYAELREKHVQNLVNYLREFHAILAANKERAVKIQAEHDKPYTVGVLEYGITATDGESEERYVETRTVYVLGKMNRDGYWNTGRGKMVKYFNQVSHTPMETHAVNGILSITVERGGVTIHFPPDYTQAQIDYIMAPIVELPRIPEQPGGLDYRDATDACMRRARAIVEGYDPDDNNPYYDPGY